MVHACGSLRQEDSRPFPNGPLRLLHFCHNLRVGLRSIQSGNIHRGKEITRGQSDKFSQCHFLYNRRLRLVGRLDQKPRMSRRIKLR